VVDSINNSQSESLMSRAPDKIDNGCISITYTECNHSTGCSSYCEVVDNQSIDRSFTAQSCCRLMDEATPTTTKKKGSSLIGWTVGAVIAIAWAMVCEAIPVFAAGGTVIGISASMSQDHFMGNSEHEVLFL
jgi:hypothetical protein